MSSADLTAPGQESAADYGILEGCFRSHREEPFRWQDAMGILHGPGKAASAGGILEVPDLRPIQPENPHYNVGVRESFPSFDTKEFFSLNNSMSGSSLLPHGRSSTRGLRLDTSLLDLGSDADEHLSLYLNDVKGASKVDFQRVWLPLSSINNAGDEGLSYPQRSNALHALLWRELRREQPELPGCATGLQESFDPSSSLLKFPISEPREPIVLRASAASVPLLSPVSCSSPFVPEASSLAIDPCTSPETPVNAQTSIITEGLKRGHLESGPSTPALLERAGQDEALEPNVKVRCLGEDDKKVDVPLPPTSWDSQGDKEKLALSETLAAFVALDPPSPLSSEPGHFSEAFEALLADRHETMMRSVEQEQLDPCDSYCRLAVPVLSFDISSVGRETQSLPAKTMFQSLIQPCSTDNSLNPLRCNDRLGAALSWDTVPKGKGKVIPDDAPSLFEMSKDVMEQDLNGFRGSASYVSHHEHALAMREQEEEELLELYDPGISPNTDSQTHKDSTAGSVASPVAARAFDRPSLSELCRSVPRKRTSSTLLMQAKSPLDAGDVLAGFVELRTGKRRKPAEHAERHCASRCRDLPKNSEAEEVKFPQAQVNTSVPTPAPSFLISSVRSRIVVSMSMGRDIIRHIARVWPPELLIDRDYSRHNTMKWSPGTAQTQVQVSPLSFEADFSPGASTGIIVTGLLKVRQRSLPGSTTLPPLRERIKLVSNLYERLIVLVSQENPEDDSTGRIEDSDLAGYTDFVQFATSLRRGVAVHFVPGREETLSRWILSFISRSICATDFERFLRLDESAWEVFLRRIGLNTYAAQVVAGLLHERQGASGLASFILMSRQERRSAFEQVLGGRRVLTSVSNVIDMPWG